MNLPTLGGLPAATNPHSIDAEREVLGAALLHPSTLARTAAMVAPADFYHPGHAALWGAILAVDAAHEPVDALTVWSRLSLDGKADRLGSLGGQGYLAELAAEVVTVENVEHHARVIASKADRRRALAALRELVAQGHDEQQGDVEWRAQLEATLLASSLGQRVEGGAAGLRPALKEWLGELGARYERQRTNGAELVGLATGFFHLDVLTGGLRPGQLVILAARPAMGKSALALNIVEGAAKTGAPCLVISEEMVRGELVERMVASNGGIDATVLRNGRLGVRDWQAVQLACSRLADLSVVIDDEPGLTIGQVRSRARRWRATTGKGEHALVVVDYLQLLSGSGDRRKGANREQEVAEISRGLKALAKELRCPVLALAQLSRKLEERADKRPMLSDLRESGAIEQDADIVTFLYRDEVYDPDTKTPGTAELIVAKHRAGSTGVLWLNWSAQHTRFAARAVSPAGDANANHWSDR